MKAVYCLLFVALIAGCSMGSEDETNRNTAAGYWVGSVQQDTVSVDTATVTMRPLRVVAYTTVCAYSATLTLVDNAGAVTGTALVSYDCRLTEEDISTGEREEFATRQEQRSYQVSGAYSPPVLSLLLHGDDQRTYSGEWRITEDREATGTLEVMAGRDPKSGTRRIPFTLHRK